MAELTQQQKEVMRRLFEDNGLVKEDVFTHKHYIIITRAGIEKIARNNEIKLDFEVISSDQHHACVRGIGTQGSIKFETFSSATPANCRNGYFLEMAIKRARSRIVLGICNLYELGVFGEEEGAHKNELD